MRNAVFYGLVIPSIVCIAVCSIWLVVVSIFMIGTGGTFSRSLPDGSIECGIPIFSTGEWLWPVFQLFGVPLIMMIASKLG